MQFTLSVEYLGSGHIYPALTIDEVWDLLNGIDISKLSKMELKRTGWQT